MKLGINDIGSVYLGANAVQKVYLGANEVWSAVDSDYQAVLDYATTKGYTLPSASQQLLQEQLVVDLKDAGVWSRLESFGVFATDGSQDFALIDWIRLTDYTKINSPTFTTNQGFEGNGVSNALNFNYVWGSSISSSNASMGQYYFSGNPGAFDLMGSRISFTDSMSMISPTRFRSFCDTVDPFYSVSLGIDIHVRDSANGGFVRNGGSNIIASGLTNQNKNSLTNYGLTAYNNNGSVAFFGSTNQIPISMSFFGESLTTTQAKDFDTAFDNYISSL